MKSPQTAFIFLWLSARLLLAQDTGFTEGGRFRVVVPVKDGHAYVLYRSASLLEKGRPVAAVLPGADGVMALADKSVRKEQAFYRVEDIPSPGATDLDGDGVSDLTELQNPVSMNVLNPAPVLVPATGANILPNRATYELLSHRDNFPGAENIREVKFVISLADTVAPKLHFANSNAYQYHYNFSRALGYFTQYSYNTGLTLFNQQAYFTNTNRKFMAGSLIAHDNYVSTGGLPVVYTIEFWPSDPVAFEFVEKAFELISASMPFLDGNVAYHPASETQLALMEQESANYNASYVNVIKTEELFGNTVFTVLNTGEGFGRLRVPSVTDTLSTRDVVIFKTLPNDLTHVAGILSEVPQTPLSHINLKAKQNDTPNAYIKNASTDPRVAPLIGEYVYYKVTADGFEIRLATQAEVDAWLESVRPTEAQFPIRDLTQTQVVALGSIGFDDGDAFGSKAANLAELRKIMPEVVPDGFAVPFYFYNRYMDLSGFYQQAQAMMADAQFQNDPVFRESALAAFRETIRNGDVPLSIHNAIGALQQSFSVGQPIRCRSSTNNEDLAGFNGAGLYDSYTHRPNEGHLEKSIKQVWASLWNYRAFEEREFYRIDHFQAAMAVLCHVNFDDEVANGVGISTNPYAPGPGWVGHYINVQVGENLVTNPDPNAIPEEFTIAYLAGATDYEIQYVRSSNLVDPPGSRILSTAQAYDLADRLGDIDAHFTPKYGGSSAFAMEIEFKITEAGDLVIKQARPWID
jgi:pyruvate,water dikinase